YITENNKCIQNPIISRHALQGFSSWLLSCYSFCIKLQTQMSESMTKRTGQSHSLQRRTSKTDAWSAIMIFSNRPDNHHHLIPSSHHPKPKE
ncbi:MAG: hypothetical protein OXT65_10985, partial [Alphaproteobacteria bacterium]|nr:hypothetical protein [Alphaproteobacteria bacterium]